MRDAGAELTRDDRVRVDVLGPLRVQGSDGRDLTPEGALQRRVFALLVLRRGHLVPVDDAVDALWPVAPPRDPVAALQNHISRLRRSVGGDLIQSTGTGYRLVASKLDLDADRLAAAVASVTSDPESLATIDELLAGWTGPAYPDLADVDDGRAESMRLEELRIGALEVCAEHRLATGQTDGLVAELVALIDRDPLRERPRSLLMTALAATGRAAEALRVYDDFRRRLGAELGVEPSAALAAQHADLLRGGDGAGWSPVSRLPVPVTSLVGRDALVDDVVAMTDAGRLVTLIGPGGVGKTRLVTEVGQRLLASRPERPVVMCELGAVGGEGAVDVIAAALGIEGRPGVGLSERVAVAIGDAAVVLVLDNCEHVLDAVAAFVDATLRACPHVTILATSRERLRLPGEQVCPVPALSLTDGDAPAVRLFVERAQAVKPGFRPDAAELGVIREIVSRLDGLPLAIELAAARLLTLDVSEIAAALDDRFALLSTGYRTSARHGSLAATVSWSFGLLDDGLKQPFLDLSTFAGAFSVTDASAVCGLGVGQVAVALDQLVERSLVMRAPGQRYILLETLRAFAAEEAAARPAAPAGERHARHFIDWMETADRRLIEPQTVPVIVEIDAALPELRNALGWSLAHDELGLAGRLVRSLMHYGFLRLRPDVLAWSARVTAADPDDRGPLAPVVWAARAYAAWMAGDTQEAQRHARRGRELSERSGETMSPRVATIFGNGELFQGRLDEATRWYQRGIADAADDPTHRQLAESTAVLARAYAGDPEAVAMADRVVASVGSDETPLAAYGWFCAGEADLAAGDHGRAQERFRQALQLAERTSASFVTGAAGASAASIEARHGDPAAAAADYVQLMTYWRRAGMWPTQWTMLRAIAGLLARLGQPHDAAVLEGAVRATAAGHRIFGTDEILLGRLGAQLRAELGDNRYEDAHHRGAGLDGDGAVEYALGALRGGA